MEKIILLGAHEKFTPKTMQIINGIMAVLFLSQGIYHLITDNGQPISLVIGIFMLLLGVGYLFYSATGFSKTSKHSAKVKFSNDYLEFKTGFFSETIRYDWRNIKSIKLSSYRLIFQMKNSEKNIGYETTATTSKEIKRAVMEFAKAKEIPVS